MHELPVLVMRSVPPSTGSEIIFGVMLNSASVTSTLAGADAAELVDAPLRKPNVASDSADRDHEREPTQDRSVFTCHGLIVTKPRCVR